MLACFPNSHLSAKLVVDQRAVGAEETALAHALALCAVDGAVAAARALAHGIPIDSETTGEAHTWTRVGR